MKIAKMQMIFSPVHITQYDYCLYDYKIGVTITANFAAEIQQNCVKHTPNADPTRINLRSKSRLKYRQREGECDRTIYISNDNEKRRLSSICVM